MLTISLQRLLLSLAVIVAVGGGVVASTGAFFNDIETSTGNTFAAGALDLKVDSQSHFNGLICTDGTWQNPVGAEPVGPEHYPQPGTPCGGTWSESDLIPDSLAFRFFNFDDLKPGDEGENTISLHVYDNDAWGCMLVDNVVDSDVTCTEPEGDSTDAQCNPSGVPGAGELGAAPTFDAWLDEGGLAGFQCNNPAVPATAGAACAADPLEGDNILNGVEALLWNDETVDEAAEGPFAMSDVLAAANAIHQCVTETGHTDYGACHGLADDGRMVGSVTYYWGLAWNIPTTAGNEIQTDALTLDMIFEVEQHRNNPDFRCTPPATATTLTLEKVIQQDGVDVVTEALWTLTATGPVVISGIETDPAVTAAPVPAGDYVLTENAVPGFTQSNLQCVGGVLVGNTVSVPLGANVVCTFTNTEEQAPAPLT